MASIAGPASISVDTTELQKLTRDFGHATLALRLAVRQSVTKHVRAAEKEAAQKASGRLVDLKLGREIHRRTGRLAASISHRIDEEAGAIFARLGLLSGGEALAYAGVQEFGGTITPKNSKLLTIPLDAAKTPAGVARFTAREAARIYTEGTWWAEPDEGGNPILWGAKDEDSKPVPLFVGVTKVTIKPAYFLTSSMNNAAERIEIELRTTVLGSLLEQRREG